MYSPFVAKIDPQSCIGCANCARTCFNGAIELFLGKAIVLDSQCKGCLVCRTACPRGAISATSRYAPKSEIENLRIRGAVIHKQLKTIEERLNIITK